MKLSEFVKMFKNNSLYREDKVNEREGSFLSDLDSDSISTLDRMPSFDLKKEPGSTTSFKDSPPSSMKTDDDETPEAEETGYASCFSQKGHNLTFQDAAYLVYGYARNNSLIDYPITDFDNRSEFTGKQCTPEFVKVIKIVQRDLGVENDGVIGNITISNIEKKNSGSEDKPATATVIAAPTSTSNAGRTISIIGKRGWTHGSAGKQSNVIPGIINSVNVQDIMMSSGQFTLGMARPSTAWGNPVLAQVMIAAAEYAQKFKNPENDNSGKIDLGNVGYKYGGPISTSTSHQVGLDIDCSFYRNDGTSRWFMAPQDFKSFDVDRNVAFMHYLVSAANPELTQCFVSNETWNLLRKAVENSSDQIKTMFKLLQSKRGYRGGVNHFKDHNNHYHIRLKHPDNSITLEQLKDKIGQEEFDKLVKQSLSNSLVNISRAGKLDIVKKDKAYSKYYDGAIDEFLKDRPGMTNIAKKYNVGIESWKNTTEDLASLIRVDPEEINKLTRKKVINFQKAIGINPDGVVGGDTLTAMAYISDASAKGLMESKEGVGSSNKIDLVGFMKTPAYRARKRKISNTIDNKFKIKKDTTSKDKGEGSIVDLLKSTAPSNFGFVVGTIDGTILASHNEDKMFYGASSNKTMAGLVQLIKFENDKEKQLDDGELRGLLTYANRVPPYTGADSNEVNRSLTGIKKFPAKSRRTGKTYTKHPHYRKGQRPKIGVINGEDVKRIAKIFDINNGKFRFGGARNKQTPLDQFKLFAGLARIDTKNFKDQKEEQYYNEHKDAFDRVIKITKERTKSQYKGGNGWLQNTGIYRSGIEGVWMKGGQASGACNIAFVFEGKYVISVYSRHINKGITKNSPGPFAGNVKHFYKEGYQRDLDIVSKTAEELMKRHVLKTLEESLKSVIRIVIERKVK